MEERRRISEAEAEKRAVVVIIMADTEAKKKLQQLTVINSRDKYPSNTFLALVALALWLGCIHFNLFLLFFSFLFLFLSKFLLNICRYACSYFPITLLLKT